MKLPKWLVSVLSKIFPNKDDNPETRLFKRTTYTILGMVTLFTLIFLSAFFFALEGEEETMVPRLIGEDLGVALLELQDKELVPRIQTRLSSNPSEKGTVLAQDPAPGSLVKAGRKVLLTISKGSVIDKIGNFVGQKIDDVRTTLQSNSQFTKQILKIKEPVSYVYSTAPVGTVLEQKPLPGTEFTDVTEFEFVVSRGQKDQTVKVDNFTGLGYQEAIRKALESSLPVAFKSRAAAGAETPGTVVTQDPVAGVEVNRGKVVELIMTTPAKLAEGQIFGIFDTALPTYEILVDLKLNLLKPNGEKTTLISMKHPGGHFAIPFLALPGDTLTLEIVGKVVEKKVVE